LELGTGRKSENFFAKKKILKKLDLGYSCNLQALDYFGADRFFPDCLEHLENCKKYFGGKTFFFAKFCLLVF